MTEEELQEEDIKIETLPIGAQQITDHCPVCMEQFDQFIKRKQVVLSLSRFVNLIFTRFVSCFQGDWEEGDNGQWHLHNAVKMEEVVYHPECFKDHQKKMERDQLDASNVSEMSESAPMEVDEEVKVEEATEEEEKEVKEEAEEAKEEPKVEDKLEAEEEVKMEKDAVKLKK